MKREPRAIVDHALSVVLVVAICIVFALTVFVVAGPKENSQFTDFYILGEKMTADKYPVAALPGKSYPMYIGIGNHEDRNTSYIVEIWALTTAFDNATNTSSITTMDFLDGIEFTLANNATTVIPYDLIVEKPGYNQVEFLLFKNNITSPLATGSDRINTSYQNLYLRLFVG